MQYTLRNRKDKKIVLDFYESPNAKGIVFLQHGCSGFKEEPHIVVMADTFCSNGLSVINFDATNSFGESDGLLSDATLTTHSQDLEDVIQWAESQPWYKEPFVLAGHSLGGASVLKYAINFPHKVSALAPLSTVIPDTWVTNRSVEDIRAWKNNGFVTKKSELRPEKVGQISFAYVEDMLSHQILKYAREMQMPILLVVGTSDNLTPPMQQQYLYELWAGPKMYKEIQGAEHSFKTEEELLSLRHILNEWLCSLPM